MIEPPDLAAILLVAIVTQAACDSSPKPLPRDVAPPSESAYAESTPSAPGPATPESAPQAAESPPPAPEITLTAADGQILQAALQRHRGSVVLVDFWATWCVPCVEAFPHTVELHRRHADQGLAVLSVSLDDPTADREAALRFLREQKATFENFISQYGASPRSMEEFQIDAGVPLVRLYDRTGALRTSFGSGVQPLTPETLDAEVEKLLAEQPPRSE